ncbi:antirestriction protein ArdA [Streptococcus oralis]|uniref:antirestriction protein ArdA n=1 Tax=Streptococcus oralis TaxID=1303 RepID=UPI0039C04DEB
MELTVLIMDDVTKKVKQFSLSVELEYVASEFGFYVGDVSITIQSIEELPDLEVERSPLFVFNELAEKLEDVDEDLVLSFIESNSSDPKALVNAEFDDCRLYPDVATDRDLGEYVVEELGVELSKETLQNYFDYEKYGRDVRLEEGGSFVDKGYFVSR